MECKKNCNKRKINSRIEKGSPALWDFVRELIENAVKQGFIE